MRLELNRESIVSLHDQLVAYFSEMISTEQLAPGDRVPSENELAKDLRISRMTVRRAFDTLVYAGLLTRRQGMGTFVATGSSGLLAFIGQTLISGISSELVAELNRAIEDRNLTGWHLLVCGAQNDPDRQLRYIETLNSHGVRGIILAPAVLEAYERNVETVHSLRRAGLPFVFIERYVGQVDSDYVVSDNLKTGQLATEHLIQLGHTRIALLDGIRVPSIQQRAEGYRAALRAHGLAPDPELVVSWADHIEPFQGDRLAGLLERGATAIFCHIDRGAMQVMDWCASHGVRVPEDLAVVGTGDLHVAQGVKPGLTTVRHDFRAMADRAVEILIDRINGKRTAASWRHEVIDVDLVVRESCGALKATPA